MKSGVRIGDLLDVAARLLGRTVEEGFGCGDRGIAEIIVVEYAIRKLNRLCISQLIVVA